MELDRGNKISPIKAKHLRDGYIIITSAQMSALVTYFGIIMGDLIPHDNIVWEFYLILYEIIDLITSPTISDIEIKYLTQLIKCHNELYISIFEEPLKPKFHIATHYPTCIRSMGPPRHYSCEKYEAFHKVSKKHARIITSRINILFTLANKLQLRLAHRFFTGTGLKNMIYCGPIQNRYEKNNVLTEISYVKINGTTYKQNYALCVGNNRDDDPIIALIYKILKSDQNEIYAIYKECFTVHGKKYLMKN